MECNNINCKHYRKHRKSLREKEIDRMINRLFGCSFSSKSGGCDKPYCKLNSKRK